MDRIFMISKQLAPRYLAVSPYPSREFGAAPEPYLFQSEVASGRRPGLKTQFQRLFEHSTPVPENPLRLPPTQSLEQLLGRLDSLGFAEAASFVLDAYVASVARVFHDFQHLRVIGVRFISVRIEIMGFRADTFRVRHQLLGSFVAIVAFARLPIQNEISEVRQSTDPRMIRFQHHAS